MLLQVVEQFGPTSRLDLGQHQQSLAAAVQLESAVIEHLYRSPQTALGHLQAAETALGMSVSLEGECIDSIFYAADIADQLAACLLWKICPDCHTNNNRTRLSCNSLQQPLDSEHLAVENSKCQSNSAYIAPRVQLSRLCWGVECLLSSCVYAAEELTAASASRCRLHFKRPFTCWWHTCMTELHSATLNTDQHHPACAVRAELGVYPNRVGAMLYGCKLEPACLLQRRLAD